MPAKKRARRDVSSGGGGGGGSSSSKQKKTKTKPKTKDKASAPAPTPVHDLPLEILTIIFQKAVAQSGVWAAMAVTHTCQRWREVGLGVPELWRDARLSISNFPRGTDASVKEMVKRCVWRSKSTITHAELQGFTRAEIFIECLQVLQRSAKTITSLTIDNNKLCNCPWCKPRRPDGKPRYMFVSMEVREAGEALLTLLSKARRLERLHVNFRFRAVRGTRLKCEARPQDLTIIMPSRLCTSEPKAPNYGGHGSDSSSWGGCSCCPDDDDDDYGLGYGYDDDEEDLPDLSEFLEKLSSGVDSIVLTDYNAEIENSKWPSLETSHQSIRFCSLPFYRVVLLARESYKDYPALEELRVDCSKYWKDGNPHLYWSQAKDKPVWMYAPSLQRVYAMPTIAAKLDAPSVTSAFLEFRQASDVGKLPQVLAAWPQLESLTIEIVASSYGSWEPASLDELIRILTPGRYGTVLSPNLRCFGILAARLAHASSFDGVLEPRWASLPWSAAEASWWYSKSYRRSWLGRPKENQPPLGANLVQLELQRRRLHQRMSVPLEGLADSNNNAVSAPGNAADSAQSAHASGGILHDTCAALEIIKLGGVQFELAAWQALKQDSTAQVTCHPEPRAEGDSRLSELSDDSDHSDHSAWTDVSKESD